ncbi:MAG TPA: signal recognition particle-docking protein FtsY [Gemmatimonadaceae bacterium]|jgi:fused signal recognition particle receptor|nr:signal recognition particle-docking protein FtsY [Gemmatimonadaceae bacterium]
MASRLLRRAGDVPTRTLWTKIKDVALTDVGAIARSGSIQGSLEKLEEVLLQADFGVPTTMRLVSEIEGQAKRGLIKTQEEFLAALQSGIEASLASGNSDPRPMKAPAPPTVILVVGVNGAGKTTFIGKLSDLLVANKMSVLVGAADTFRAGAIDQLRTWAQRAGADFVGGNPGSDPASVAFDAVDAGINRGKDVVIVDTAGRLHTSGSLMDEMKKINRVIGKRLPGAPHETLLVLDGTIGQNAVAQAKNFAEAIPVTGLVVTKIDGTARGGIVLAVHEALNVPVKFIGIGEKATDLEQFDPRLFAREVLEQ